MANSDLIHIKLDALDAKLDLILDALDAEAAEEWVLTQTSAPYSVSVTAPGVTVTVGDAAEVADGVS